MGSTNSKHGDWARLSNAYETIAKQCHREESHLSWPLFRFQENCVFRQAMSDKECEMLSKELKYYMIQFIEQDLPAKQQAQALKQFILDMDV